MMTSAVWHSIQQSVQFLDKGGVLMYPILLVSVISLAIFFERWRYYRRASCNIEAIYSRLNTCLDEQRFEDAMRLCALHERAVVPGALQCVLENRQRSVEDLEKLVSAYGTRAIQDLSRHVRFLGTLGNITPLIGLLGTVVGMVKTFMQVAEHSGHVNPALLAGGIWEALLTTAAGLTVAIPTVLMYHHFENRIDRFAFQMTHYSLELIEALPKDRSDI